ncbi:SET domain-containing protein [Calocera viscosa TUFC12733]|uniref:SET domain-containing protein n=1 Tax=Calocera viscosa (strain TUFC12733) TaxID=1330018 RepID=A0A167K0Y9_CALVF|nr:SET domain-containing protein [Calocera viscosa TUFC12733]
MSEESSKHIFVVTDIPGKHQGIIASEDISRGALVLAEAPLIIQPGHRTNKSIATALQSVSKEDQRAYLSLWSSKSKEDSDGVFKDIFDNNCFQLGEEPRGGIFLTGSRFNHSCSPNVHRHWHAPSGKLRFYAIFDIKAGDELCIAYFNIENVTSEERQARFRKHFGCDCQCDICTLPANELQKSDARREAKAELDSVILSSYAAPRRAMQAILRILAGLKLDRVEEGITDVHYLAFQVCVAAADAQSAKIWAQRFLDSRVLMCGSEYDTRECTKLSSFIEDPRSHQAWGWGTRANLLNLTQSWQDSDSE